MGELETDKLLGELFRRNAPRVNEPALCGRVAEGGARVRLSRRRARRTRIVAVAFASLVLAVGAAYGVYRVVTHFQVQPTLVLTDSAVSPTESQATGFGHLGLQVPRSVSDLKLADLWEEMAIRLRFDSSTAWLHSIEVKWNSDGQLCELHVEALTPDGRSISMNAMTDEHSDTQHVEVRGSAGPGALGRLNQHVFAVRPTPEPIFVSADAFLEALDRAGLMEIGAQSGLDISSDPAESYKSIMTNSALGFPESLPPGLAVNGVMLALGWMPNPGDDWVFTSAEEASERYEPYRQNALPLPPLLSVDGGDIERLEAAQLSSVPLPALLVGLRREWTATDATGESGIFGLGGFAVGADILLRLPKEGAKEETVEAQPVDDRLEGLAYTTPEMNVCRVRGGATETLWESPGDVIAVVTHPSASYGVSYSLGNTLVLRGGGTIQTTSTAPADAGGFAENSMSETPTAVMAIPVDDPGASRVLLESPTDGVGLYIPAMNRVVFDESGDRLWLSVFFSVDVPGGGYRSQCALQTAQPHTSALATIPLGHPFGGDFAVSPDGDTIVYIGFTDNGPAVTLRTGDAEEELSLGLATAYHPVFSPDGRKICLVGSMAVDGSSGLWLYDLKSGDCRQIKSTEGLTPTYPAFSPDGKRIAFRDFELSDIWTVTVEGKELTRYALTTEEAPIAW